jgi:hypothetical protein
MPGRTQDQPVSGAGSAVGNTVGVDEGIGVKVGVGVAVGIIAVWYTELQTKTIQAISRKMTSRRERTLDVFMEAGNLYLLNFTWIVCQIKNGNDNWISLPFAWMEGTRLA